MTISTTTPTLKKQENQKRTLIFSYGTLKQGFANHKLMQHLISQNHATFIGNNFTTDLKLPLVQGPHGVPFLLNLPCTTTTTSCHNVSGELYSVTEQGLEKLDVLEGVTLGHYERLPVVLRQGKGVVVMGEAYFGHRSFAEKMWRRCGELGLECFDREVEKGYVRRDLRPKDRSFREMIEVFCASS